MAWADVKKEMTEEKGLDGAVADKIGEYVKHKGGPELLELLQADAALMANASAKTGIEEMSTLFKYLEAYGIVNKVCMPFISLVLLFNENADFLRHVARSRNYRLLRRGYPEHGEHGCSASCQGKGEGGRAPAS